MLCYSAGERKRDYSPSCLLTPPLSLFLPCRLAQAPELPRFLRHYSAATGDEGARRGRRALSECIGKTQV